MIASHELRIGNSVLRAKWLQKPYTSLEDLEYDQITVSHNDIAACVVKPSHFKPIPLTPEILGKCGIERTGNLASSASRKFYKIGRIIIETIPENRIAVYIDSPTELILISFQDYLHQLQNLYFALTGEELIYTP